MRKTIIDVTEPDRGPIGVEGDRLHKQVILNVDGRSLVFAPDVARRVAKSMLHIACLIDGATIFGMDDLDDGLDGPDDAG